MEAFFIGAQEGSRYDRFWALSRGVSIPSVGGLFPPQRECFGNLWVLVWAEAGGELGQGRGRAWGKVGAGSGPTHDLARTPDFGSSGVLFHILGSLSSSPKILGIIPKKQTYKRALQRIYLERCSVHACIQLCTRGYTVVYTRVYSSLLGRSYSLGISRLGHGYFYLRSIHLDDLALAL